jgi:TetR/AcrR family transcriptional regulator, cholesterol catabolism regulator
MAELLRIPRQNSRRLRVVDEAARLFAERGYHAASVRDIAAACGMTVGAIYSHFASKEELLVAVYEEGVRRISSHVEASVARQATPRARLEAAAAAHLDMLLAREPYAQVIGRVLPQDAPQAAPRLTALRDSYERRFAELIDGVALPRGASRRHLRLLLLGALNAAQVWYRPGGESPAEIARRFMELLKL